MSGAARARWQAVRDEIHEGILTGRYRPGDRLPRDADIAAALNCARSTVQRAMQDLSDSGLVQRRRKGGTHVRPDPVTRATLDIPITRREVEQRGGRYSHHLIARREAVPPLGVLAALELLEPQTMLQLEALHLSDGRPYILEDRWISLTTSPEARQVDFTAQSANEWLVRNKPYSRCDLRFYALSADDRIADAMQTAPGTALLVVERSTWIDARPITNVRAITAPGHSLSTSG